MSHPAEPERHDARVGVSNPNQSTWEWERPYLGPPEEGQPRMGSARPAPAEPAKPRERVPRVEVPRRET